MKINEDGLKEIETLDDAWTACLELWKYLSEHRMRFHKIPDVKGVVLDRLEYAEMYNYCPLCQYGNIESIDRTNVCHHCPFYKDKIFHGCLSSPYKKWEDNLRNSTIRAREFYECLLDLKERTT